MKAIRKMKNKKAADRLGWKAEWIYINRIKTENQISKQWQLTTVKSIHKGGVKKTFKRIKEGYFW